MKHKVWPGLFVLGAVLAGVTAVALPSRAAAMPVLAARLRAGQGPGSGTVLYADVEATGANDGSSWEDAFTDLQSALEAAVPGDQIWVAAGTYYPSVAAGGVDDRYKTFQMLNGVGLYGGFDPTTGDVGWDDRDWANNVTALSGDIGTPGVVADNCYHVFYHPSGTGLDASAVLDGFVVTGGNANGQSDPDYHGGGMYNYSSSPALTNCTFAGNSAGYRGGGIFNYGSSPTLANCTFTENSAGSVGGGLYNTLDSSPPLTDCTFTGNSAVYYGGGMLNYGSSPALTNCTFTGNSAGYRGGGMYDWNSSPTLVGCTFTGNSAGEDGGGMFNYDSSPTLANCTFTANSAGYYGGGMYNNLDSSPAVTDCTFAANSADYYGGGMLNYGSSPALTNCSFTGNSADYYGGGMHNWNSAPALTNCTFTANSAELGGGVYNWNSSPALTNCTFTGNSADYSGGGMHSEYSSPALTNCVLWGDTPYEVYGTATVTYSDVQGGYEGQGNIDADPLWVDPASGDYHLTPDSPCIDAGTNDAPNLPPFDFEGDDRIVDGDGDGIAIVDMGVDEFVAAPTMHVGGIEGFFSLDPLGRPLLRSHVLVVDQAAQPLGGVQVDASITAPCGGPYARTRVTKPTGNARFHWGCETGGTWELCVDNLTRDGYSYEPGDNVITCQEWQD